MSPSCTDSTCVLRESRLRFIFTLIRIGEAEYKTSSQETKAKEEIIGRRKKYIRDNSEASNMLEEMLEMLVGILKSTLVVVVIGTVTNWT